MLYEIQTTGLSRKLATHKAGTISKENQPQRRKLQQHFIYLFIYLNLKLFIAHCHRYKKSYIIVYRDENINTV